ncbi:MAG: hypothetical protein QOG83_1971 [Alphaproteobacteria bacterium]|nr:hypothetical protein [Alphaproteobacteria bacterium]
MNSSKGFGKRGPTERKPYVAAQDGQGGGLDINEVVRAPMIRQFGGIMFGLAVVVCLGGGYVVAMKGFGRALNQHWEQNVGYPDVEDAYKRTAGAAAGGADVSLEQIHNDCKSRSDFVRLDKDKTRALDGFDGLYSGEYALYKAAFYVSCLAGEQPERFCRDAHRGHLIAALKDYYRLMGRVREERIISTSGPFAANRMALFGTASREIRPTTPMPSAQTDERVVNGLRVLIQNGYVSRKDLTPVMGPPGDLELALQGVEPRRTGCI